MRESNTDRVRAVVLAEPGKLFTGQMLRDRIPGIGRSVYETLCKMHRTGELRRVSKMGKSAYKYNTSYKAAARADLPAAPKATALQQAAITGIARSTPRRPRSNALLYTVIAGPSQTHCPRRALSARIADDIAAFESGGGQVERLGNTPFFKT